MEPSRASAGTGQSANRLPDNIEAIYPLTPMQKALLFHALAAPAESAIYFQQLTWVIRSELDVGLFREAWIRVVHRHPVLRTFFLWQGRDEPVQCVCTRVRIPWHEHDWRDNVGKSAERLSAYLAVDRKRAFRLSEAPLVRLHLIRLERESFQFVWSFHHIVMDGWCLSIVAAEVFAIYRHLKEGVPLSLENPPPYRDFVTWIRRQDHARAREAWRNKLRGFSSPTSLRIDRPINTIGSAGDPMQAEWLRLSESVTTRLRATAKRRRCTLSTLVQAAWGLLLRCYSGEDDVVFGITIAGRPASLPRVDCMVGLFINTLPVRVRACARDRFQAVLSDLMVQQIERDEISFSSLAEVQSVSEVPRGTALFDSIIVFENYPIDATLRRPGDSLAIHGVEFFDRTNYPLTLIVVPGNELALKLSHDSERLGSDAVHRLGSHFQTLLESIAARPDGRVIDFELVPREELIAVRKMNRTEVDWDVSKPLHTRIEAQAELTPDALAVIVPAAPNGNGTAGPRARELTYRELNCRANRVAHCLRERGVQPDEPVGIYMERSAELVIGMLAIQKAGGACVPLDPSYPPERLRFMLQDTHPRVVLSLARQIAGFAEASCDVVALDDLSVGIEQRAEWNPQLRATADCLAYIIYTSGSTGKPKGAMNTHRGISNRLLWMQQAYQLRPSDRVLQKTPVSFDVSVWEFFWPLMTGAQLVIAEPGGHQDPEYLIRTIRNWAVTTIHFVPSMLRIFLEAPEGERCSSLRLVICSGEALPRDLEIKFFERFDAQLHNLYGPTEAAVDVTAWQCDAESERNTVPIGRPIANTEIHLLDRDLRPVPIGVPGELYIGGFNLGRGYWKRPDLTAERFFPDPFAGRPGARLYKTGDLARRMDDGAIEYLDRLDHQVKIRGFRVELGEVETWLTRAPGVKECAVICDSENGADKRLIAYVVGTQNAQPGATPLHRFLRDRLPNYMVPSAFVFLPSLPLSVNGKLDRRALPKLDASRPDLADRFVMPQSEAERKIADSWLEVLQIDKVGVHDNFFELGGNSLLLLPIQGRLQRIFARPIPLLTFFRIPTVHLLAEFLTAEPDAEQHEDNNGNSVAHDMQGRRAANVARLRQARLEHRASSPDSSHTQ